MLKVQAVPYMPVSFTSVGKGLFENNEKAITIEADSNGEASVNFICSSKNDHQTTILCGSAVCLGRLEFLIDTKIKK